MKISKEQQRLISLISHFGCLDVNQAYKLLEPNDKKISTMLINMLINNNILELIHGNYLVMYGEKDKVDKNMINCIWVMLDLAQNLSDIDDAMKAQKPAKVFITINNNESYELVPLTETTTLPIKYMQDRYIAASKQFSDTMPWCTFITDNKLVLSTIKKCNLQIPFKVMYIDNINEDGTPHIKRFISTPKNNE